MMKMKNLKQWNFKLQALLLCGICSCGILSSCSNSEDLSNKTGSAIGNQLVLTINTANPGSRATSGTNLKVGSDDNAESQINRLTVGIFGSDGKVKTIQEYTQGATITPTTFTQTGNVASATVITTSLVSTDDVLVAVNAPSGIFGGAKDEATFNGMKIGIDRALATSWDVTSKKDAAVGTVEATNNIPMYGKGSISTVSGNLESKVDVYHQLAKITLDKVSVDFDQSGPYKSATFQPTAFFLINVPTDLAFSADASTGSITTDTWQGGNDAATTTYKGYLGSGDLGTTYTTPLKYSTDGSGETISPKQFFYTMPNSDATTNNTKLVIAGKFSPDGTTEAKPVYYPVNINWVYNTSNNTSAAAPNGGATAKAVYPNKNYVCDVTIKTKGADSPTQSIDPSTASLTVTVKGFDEADQSTVFE